MSPLPDYDYYYYHMAAAGGTAQDKSLEPHNYSRAYINFKDPEDIYVFRDKFDGYVFIDGKGNEYPAMVEFAPYSKIPKAKSVATAKRKDPKMGTLEEDPEYIQFLESMDPENKENLHFNPEQHMEEIETRAKERGSIFIKKTTSKSHYSGGSSTKFALLDLLDTLASFK